MHSTGRRTRFLLRMGRDIIALIDNAPGAHAPLRPRRAKGGIMITARDKRILRETAAHQMELAAAPRMAELEALWLRHNACLDSRPTVYVEWATFAHEVIPPLMRCTGEEARAIEYALLANFAGHELFDDDSVVPDYMPVRVHTHFVPFGIEVRREHASAGGLGHRFREVLRDLGEDFGKLGKSTYGADMARSQALLERYDALFGDILPARLAGECLYAVPTQCIVHIMSMENMLFAMCDYPELFHRMMDMLTSDYIEYFRFREARGLILPTTRTEPVGNGSFAFTDALPGPEVAARRPLTTRDVWGFLDSQETTGISPDMYAEFIYPYYRRIAEQYGMLSYGCCEAVDPIWDRCLSALPNLRKLSISPWCNEELMGERLRGSNIVYHRKPSPNMLGVGAALDEDAVRASARRTLAAARGCTIEFAQRDVYTVGGDMGKVRRYVELIRQCCQDA